ncbi:GH92 family glycosyl hydrolase, partial [Rarobacter incanus]
MKVFDQAPRARRRSVVVFAAAAAMAATGALAQAPAALAVASWSTSFESGDSQVVGTALGAVPTTFTGITGRPLTVSVTPSNVANSGSSESVGNLSDGSGDTKWYTGNKPSGSTPFEVVYAMGVKTPISGYSLTSGADAADWSGRNPKSWAVYGSNDGSAWTPLDNQSGQSFAGSKSVNNYATSGSPEYSYYKLAITENNGANDFQLADWTLKLGTVQAGSLAVAQATGPTGGWTQKEGAGFTGKASLMYAGKHIGAGAVTSKVEIRSNVNASVATNTQFSYKIYPVLNSDWEYSATYVALDVQFDDGTWLSANADQRDTNGFHVQARKQGSEKALYANQWNSVAVDLSAYKGRTIKNIAITYDNDTAASGTSIVGYVDDIAIKTVAPIDASQLVNYVDTRRGTNANDKFSRGSNIPATAVPNGFNFWTPFTNTDDNKLYQYARQNNSDNLTTLQGVGISHETSPWMGDSDSMSIMPSTSATTTNADRSARAAAFSHDDEIARPDYYSVKTTNGLQVEVAPTMHAGIMKFTFPAGQNTGTLLIDGALSQDSSFQVSGNKLTGWVSGNAKGGSGSGSTRMYIYGEFDSAATAQGSANGGRSGYYARFDTAANKTVTLRIATSFIGDDQAQSNFAQEVANKSFSDIQTAAALTWQERLSVIDMSQSTTATDADKVKVYSSLYRLNMYPNARWEKVGTEYKYASAVGGTSADKTDQNVPVMTGKNYVNNGFWDTYRTAWPLYSLLYPEFATELVDGFLDQYDDGGWVSRWSSPGYSNIMTGTSSDVAFADVYISTNSMSTAQAEHAFAAAVKNATVSAPSEYWNNNNRDEARVGRKGLQTSTFLGYSDSNLHESVSWGLEGNINDAGIAAMAEKLAADTSLSAAKRARYAEQATYYRDRAKNYVNMFNTEAGGFFTTRNADGTFSSNSSNYNPKTWWGPYTETNGWNFAFHAPFDTDGLAGLYGSTTAGIKAKLDQFYATPEKTTGTIHEELEASAVRIGQLGMSNQVSHHIPYISAATGDATRTQEVVRESLQRLFVGSDIGQGYPGDEDNGEMSAWYLFSAMGFYPLSLASGEYTVGSPAFDKMIINRSASQGGKLTITAQNNSYDNVYVSGVKVGDKALSTPSLSVSDLRAASTLDFTMQSTPSTWGNDQTRAVSAPAALQDLTKSGNAQVSATGISDTAKLVDDTSDTKSAMTVAGSTLKAVSTQGPVKVKTYTLTSATKAAAPTSWKLQGSNSGTDWTDLDSRSGSFFDYPLQTVPFQVEDPGSYSQYRIVFGNGSELAEVELLVDPDATGATGEVEAAVPSDISVAAGEQTPSVIATVSGIADVSAASATVDFGDGSDAQAATVAAGGIAGSVVKATHSYDRAGEYPVTVKVTYDGVTTVSTGVITVTRDARFESNFDNACLTNAGTAVACDGASNANGYRKESLAEAKSITDGSRSVSVPAVVQGTQYSVPGDSSLKFTLPQIASGEKDNLTGETTRKVRVYVPADATKVSFIGMATETSLSKAAKLIFDDGTTKPFNLEFNNWDSATGADGIGAGNVVVGASMGRWKGTSTTVDAPNNAFKLWATASVTLEQGHGGGFWLEMPAVDSSTKARQHVFAIASDGSGTLTEPVSIAAGQAASAKSGAATTFDLATVSAGDQSGERTAVVNWGDGSEAVEVSLAESGAVTGQHTYAKAGIYRVSIVADDSVTSAQTSTTITVTDSEKTDAAVTLTALPAAPVAGDSIALTATVPSDATGTVSFKSSGEVIGTAAIADGKASYTVSSVEAGVYTFAAEFAGDAKYNAAASQTVTVTVKTKDDGGNTGGGDGGNTGGTDSGKAASLSAPRFSKLKQSYGAIAKRRATVAVVVTNATQGTVTFKSGAKVLATAKIRRQG